MTFNKFEAYGNDYLIVAQSDLSEVESIAEFAKRICARHRGVGADGVAIWEKSDSETADFNVRIINPDGGEANFSGNGTRCAAAFLHHQRIWTNENLRLQTRSGVKNYRLLEIFRDGHYGFAAEIGQPKFDSLSIPMFFAEARSSVVDFPFEIENQSVSVTALNVGNPAACVFTADFDELDWRKIGANLEHRAAFPERTNVIFVKVVNQENLEIRIWERGAGETSASGTCATAAAVASAFTNRAQRRVTVHSEGGQMRVEWRETDDEIVLTGRADFVFNGEFVL